MSAASQIVNEARNRQTGTVTQVVDNRDESFDVGGQAWISVCVDHGNYCEHTTRELAFAFARAPLEWCAACQEEDVDRSWRERAEEARA